MGGDAILLLDAERRPRVAKQNLTRDREPEDPDTDDDVGAEHRPPAGFLSTCPTFP